MSSLKRLEDIALSNYDIMRLLNKKVKIVLYPDLHKYKSIDSLVYPYDCCILLYESKKNYGHWTAIIKRDNAIEFFNSYGGDRDGLPDASLKLINPAFRIISNQIFPYLRALMYNSNYELHYNEFTFQKKGHDIRTCGRHCVVRCLCKNMNIYQYKELLDKLCKYFNTDYDGVVTILTS
jgi:hypothetical protein